MTAVGMDPRVQQSGISPLLASFDKLVGVRDINVAVFELVLTDGRRLTERPTGSELQVGRARWLAHEAADGGRLPRPPGRTSIPANLDSRLRSSGRPRLPAASCLSRRSSNPAKANLTSSGIPAPNRVSIPINDKVLVFLYRYSEQKLP